jgi:hypothetical protein
MKCANASKLDRKSGVRWANVGHPSREVGLVEVGRLLAQLAVGTDFLFECLYGTQA